MPTERLFLHEENLVSQDFNKTSPKVKFRRESLRPFCSRFGGGGGHVYLLYVRSDLPITVLN